MLPEPSLLKSIDENSRTNIWRDYFVDKLADFITVRHPDIARAGRLIVRRSRTAYDVFLRALGSGRNISSALGDADRILYHGLIFSRFDMVCTVLENEFPLINGKNIRTAALQLLPWCEDVFNRYAPHDDFYSIRPPGSLQMNWV